ncbi:response regulator transcription factor [Lipingzhangella sp. LS1_29]|uniref:Response regulator transcription factor n=1 Tax=Lipingzhangella rawalii TaxID=2055835 RepID=A0ABU2H6N1_9ACTN|nr:response regulator transcription factor [Lipingzhangella rawalii]MDS1270951.1 response regulator transcription factor [Lipingzhangella rawalii]
MSTPTPHPASQPTPDPIRLLIADDNPVVRAGLVSLLEGNGPIRVVAQAGDGQEAITLAEHTVPDVALVDVRMPRMDGVRALQRLSELTRVVMLTQTEDPEVVQSAVRGGAYGYLVHGAFSVAELIDAVRKTASGAESPMSPAAVRALMDQVRSAPRVGRADAAERFQLTEREVEVLGYLVQGLSNAEIAQVLVVAEKTVKNHTTRIYSKLGVRRRSAAIAAWQRALDDGSEPSSPNLHP